MTTIIFTIFKSQKCNKKVLKIPIYKGIRSTKNMYHRQTAEGHRWDNPKYTEGMKNTSMESTR